MEKIKAKKQFGQNFLKDESILNKIIEAMPKNSNHIVEIGPGLGDLTQRMLKYKDMTAYEIDSDLLAILRSKFANEIQSQRLELIHTDVLDIWKQNKTLYQGKYDLIANLPYYVATNIILQAIEDDNCENIIVMIQKEVAQKFAAHEGEKEFSSLGVIAKLVSKECKILFDVASSCFEPAPKVTSSVLYIKKDGLTKLDSNFKSFLKVAFSQPRKKLSKNLSSLINKDFLNTIYRELNIEDNIRPHEVSSSLYRQMHNKVIINDKQRTQRDETTSC
ncbi:MAG: 16S rRNA (adenine(1518)-N(6)/adenine(1519)-N(6))-dimethyltransferase RsmA [Arcobacteraceae bacterium]|jgi:16S rRNA (adenine1518-N6/adenine1519-N6)-dimethyltransferase|nr:16S rRNA (adenine(1518)-N(6)/adenine(1519)-N(6))-dimethyltransferase RsmA [Arcobacteraceae bacterium]